MTSTRFAGTHEDIIRPGNPSPPAPQADWTRRVDRIRDGLGQTEYGALLAAAEAEFDIMITTDRQLRFQQNLAGRRLAVLVLPTTRWRVIEAHVDEILAALEHLTPGELKELRFAGL